MAKVVMDVGPAADFPIPAAMVPVGNIQLTVVDRGGPVLVRGVVECSNGSVGAKTYTCAIRKNGIVQGASQRQIVVGAGGRAQVVVELIDSQTVVGDFFDIGIGADAADPASVIVANRAHLIAVAVTQDTALVAGIGPAAA